MANSLTLNILENLSARMNGGKSTTSKGQSSSENRVSSAAPVKAVSLDSYASLLGAGSKSANNQNSSRPISDVSKNVALDYESALKSLINKKSGDSSSLTSSSSSKSNSVAKSGTVGLDDLIKTLGR